MGLEYGAVVLGIVLHTDIPRMLGYLNSLYQLGVGIDTYALHASCLELLLVFCIELVAVQVDEQAGITQHRWQLSRR